MSTFWILFVEILAMLFAASSLEYVRRHPDLFAGAEDTPGDRLAMLSWMPPGGPPGWYVGAALSGADAACAEPAPPSQSPAAVGEGASDAARADEHAAARGSISVRTTVPRPRAPR
jgi:hypothetical protein